MGLLVNAILEKCIHEVVTLIDISAEDSHKLYTILTHLSERLLSIVDIKKVDLIV